MWEIYKFIFSNVAFAVIVLKLVRNETYLEKNYQLKLKLTEMKNLPSTYTHSICKEQGMIFLVLSDISPVKEH